MKTTTTAQTAEMLDLLTYLAENGYDFEELTFDDFLKYGSVDFLREIVRNFLDEDPTA